MKNKLILLVEDNPDEEALTLRALRHCKVPHQVVVARDGAEALDYLFSTNNYSWSQVTANNSVITPPPEAKFQPLPELILLDLKLPKVNGLEVLTKIREHDRTKFVPVVMLTSSLEEQDLSQSYSLGCNSYIRKPVDFLEFTQAVEQIGFYWLLLNQNALSVQVSSNSFNGQIV